MTDPNSNEPHVPQPPRDPQPPREPEASVPTPPEPESARTTPYDAASEGGPTVDTEAREAPPKAAPPEDEPPAGSAPGATPPETATGDHPWSMACHLSGLLNLCCPVLGIVSTIVIWQMNRKEDPEVDWHGKEALNFQLNLIPIVLVLVAMIALKDVCFLFGIGVVLLPILWLGALIYILVASIRAAEGVRYRYPHIKRLLD